VTVQPLSTGQNVLPTIYALYTSFLATFKVALVDTAVLSIDTVTVVALLYPVLKGTKAQPLIGREVVPCTIVIVGVPNQVSLLPSGVPSNKVGVGVGVGVSVGIGVGVGVAVGAGMSYIIYAVALLPGYCELTLPFEAALNVDVPKLTLVKLPDGVDIFPAVQVPLPFRVKFEKIICKLREWLTEVC